MPADIFLKALAFVVLCLIGFLPLAAVIEFLTSGLPALCKAEFYVGYAKGSLFIVMFALTVMGFVAIVGQFIDLNH